MKKKSEWLESYFNITPDIAYFIDMEGRLQHWNASLEQLCGCTPDNMQGRACIEFVSEKDRSVVVDDIKKVFANGSYANIYHFIGRDGTLIPFHCNASVTYNEFGTPDGFAGIGRNISEQKRVEQDLRESQNKFHTIFQSSPVGIFHSLPEGRFLTANPALAKMLGYESPDELISLVTNINTQLYCDPNKRVEIVATMSKNDAWSHAECDFFRKDGSVILVSIKSRKVSSSDGTPAYFEGFIDNITERRQSEIALYESEEKYRGLFENAGDLAYGTDLNGNFTALSASLLQVTGYSRDELINAPISKILSPDNLKLARQMTAAKLDSNLPVTRYELEITDKTGKQIPLELVTTLTYKNGVPIGVQGLGRDISERKRFELAQQESIKKLEEKELAKTRFLAAAGHDLRQPLAAANLFIDALKFTQPTPNQTQIIQRLDQAMSNFNGLLDALLNVSRLDAGMIKPEYTLTSLAYIFGWLEQNFAPLASEKQIRLRLSFPTKANIVVRTDIGLLNSVLMNLVSNALKFTSSGGILVSARIRGSNVLFQIWDTGIGIPDDSIQFIFDEFYQINNPQRDRTRGLGLGLAIAKRAISLLGGKITCRSQLKKGSVFEFILPLTDTATVVPHPEASLNHPVFDQAAFVKNKRFVIVEDDALVAEALSKALVEMGAMAEFYHSAEVALNHPGIGDADYFIVDYMLGGTLNGIEFLERLRRKLSAPVKAVIMTGETSSAFVRDTAHCAWPVQHKPVNISKLIDCLRTQTL